MKNTISGTTDLMSRKNSVFYKQLGKLVIPIAVQNFMSALVSASDALMLGFLDQSSLSAVSLATQVSFVLNLFLMAITIGLTILAAQYWGKEDVCAVEHVLAIALRLSVAVSVVFAAASFFVPGLLMRIFTNDEALIRLGEQYLQIVAVSFLFTAVSQVYLCVMKNSGRVIKSTVYGSVALVLNLVLNTVLIFGCMGIRGMGIRGAAVATLLARTIELLLVLNENRKKDVVRMRASYLRQPKKTLRADFKKYTAPVLANEIVWGCGFTMFSVIMGHLGTDAVAANAIANIVKNLIACVAVGVGTGSGIMVGNELGRGNTALAKEYGDRLCHISIAIGALSGILILLASPLILKFSGALSNEAKGYLQIMLYICSYYMIGKSVNSTLVAGIFCAGGDTKFGLLCDIVTMWIIIVPIGFFAAFVLKLPVLFVYLLLNLDETVKLPAVYVHYKKYRWVKNLTE